VGLSQAEKQARYRDRKRHELAVRKQAEELSKRMLSLFPDRDGRAEAGRAGRACAYWESMI